MSILSFVKSSFSFLLMFALLTFTSCDKEELESETDDFANGSYPVQGITTTKGDSDKNSNTAYGSTATETSDLDEICFDITFPITIIFPDGTSQEVNSEDEIEMSIDDFYDANPDVEEEPTFDYPVTVTLDDGTTQELNSDEDVEAILETCEMEDEEGEDEEDEEDGEDGDSEDEDDEGDSEDSDDEDDEDDEGDEGDSEDSEDDDDEDEDDEDTEYLDDLCFDINFPVTIVLPDGSSQMANDEDEFEDSIEDFYDANPDVETDPTLVYPVTVTLEDGTTQELNSDVDLEALIDSCE